MDVVRRGRVYSTQHAVLALCPKWAGAHSDLNLDADFVWRDNVLMECTSGCWAHLFQIILNAFVFFFVFFVVSTYALAAHGYRTLRQSPAGGGRGRCDEVRQLHRAAEK